MNVHAWRIVKARHASTAFSGAGAKVFGGRWNSPGVAAVYVAGATSLAMLELLVHLHSRELLERYALFVVTFNESLMTVVEPGSLPKNWRKSPPPSTIQQIGDDWLARAASAVLRVPSALVPTEWNYLLNPAHRDFHRIIVGPRQPVRFDPRLIKAPGAP